MQFIVTKQIAVEAETPEEAVAKSATDGKVMSLNCSPRPISAAGITRPNVAQNQSPLPPAKPQ